MDESQCDGPDYNYFYIILVLVILTTAVDWIVAGQQCCTVTSQSIVSWIRDTIRISETTPNVFDTNIRLSNECGRFGTFGRYFTI